MRDELADLLARHTVVERATEVEPELVGSELADEHGAGREAAVTRRQTWTLPDVAEEHFRRQLDEIGRHRLDRRGGCGGPGLLRRITH